MNRIDDQFIYSDIAQGALRPRNAALVHYYTFSTSPHRGRSPHRSAVYPAYHPARPGPGPAAGQPTLWSGILEDKAGDSRRGGQLPHDHKLMPENFGLQRYRRGNQAQSQRPEHAKQAGNSKGHRPGYTPVFNAVKGHEDINQNGEDRRQDSRSKSKRKVHLNANFWLCGK